MAANDDEDTAAVLVDLPEFGGLKDWQDCLAELLAVPEPRPFEVADAIVRCQHEIAEIQGHPQVPLQERMTEDEVEFDFL